MIRASSAFDDLRAAARAVRRRPLFASAIAFLIAVGIGLTSSTFAVVDAMLLRKLPVPNPDELVHIAGSNEEAGGTLPLSVFERLERNLSTAAAITAWLSTGVDVQVRGQTNMAGILGVAGDYYAQLGARPQLGRLLRRSDTQAVTVVSDAFWRDYLGAAPDVIGKTVNAGVIPLVIVGVAEPKFRDADSLSTISDRAHRSGHAGHERLSAVRGWLSGHRRCAVDSRNNYAAGGGRANSDVGRTPGGHAPCRTWLGRVDSPGRTAAANRVLQPWPTRGC